ncbi:hypothetical protein IP88_10225 [alpha proteobacterium AAP81b]|nr:hypothetical protein IP88_10225 [alpha proteobacterium AAP81b]
MIDFDGQIFVLRLGGAVNTEIDDEAGAREQIEKGHLRRDTMVTAYGDGAPTLRKAGDIACLAAVFESLLGADERTAKEAVPPTVAATPAAGEAPIAIAAAPAAPVATPAAGPPRASPPVETAPPPLPVRAPPTSVPNAGARTITPAPAPPGRPAAAPPVVASAAAAATPRQPPPRQPLGGYLLIAGLVAVVVYGILPDQSDLPSPAATETVTSADDTMAAAPEAEPPRRRSARRKDKADDASADSVAADSSTFKPQSAEPRVPTYPTSFDCDRATSPDEVTICHDAELAALDVRSDRAYRALMAQIGSLDRLSVRAGQRRWLETRRACADAPDSVVCIRQSYEGRIANLQESARRAAAAPAAFERRDVSRSSGARTRLPSVNCALPNGEVVAMPREVCRVSNGVPAGE